jgi:hypothetical protein
MSRDGEPWLTPIPANMPRREILARSIYRQRPFRTAMSGRVMDGFLSVAHEFDWDSAPDFYQRECFELADGIIYDLALAEQGSTPA